MPYKYSKIYNATKGVWAHDVAGEDDAQKVCEDNEWDSGDALVGFYADENDAGEFHIVIYCQPGYAVYVQAEDTKDRAEFMYNDVSHRIPPAILVNLNDAYDGEFLHNKAYDCMMDSDEESDEGVEEVTSHIPINQKVIELLRKCYNSTDNPFKKEAYNNAIDQIGALWAAINSFELKCLDLGDSIHCKIEEYLMGIPEEDIINS
jgi:hypothetical protein